MLQAIEEGHPMLEPWIIDQIRRREEEERRRSERSQLELPVPETSEDRPGSDAGDEDGGDNGDTGTKRGVVIIAM
jgi:hypothetical protein